MSCETCMVMQCYAWACQVDHGLSMGTIWFCSVKPLVKQGWFGIQAINKNGGPRLAEVMHGLQYTQRCSNTIKYFEVLHSCNTLGVPSFTRCHPVLVAFWGARGRVARKAQRFSVGKRGRGAVEETCETTLNEAEV